MRERIKSQSGRTSELRASGDARDNLQPGPQARTLVSASTATLRHLAPASCRGDPCRGLRNLGVRVVGTNRRWPLVVLSSPHCSACYPKKEKGPFLDMKELPEPPDGLDPVYLDNVLAKISNARPSKLRTLRDDLQLIIDRLDNVRFYSLNIVRRPKVRW